MAASLLISRKNSQHPGFFVVSSGRSGTTLLRKLLVNSGQVHVPPESNDWIPNIAIVFTKYFYKNWGFKVSKSFELLQNDPDFEFWKIDLNAFKQKLLDIDSNKRNFYGFIELLYTYNIDKTNLLIGDKTPFLVLRLNWIKTLFPNARIIHLLRDGRDVISSRMENFNENIEEATSRWTLSLEEIDKNFNANDPNFIEIKYEDLVSNPRDLMKQVCSFLNIPYSETIFENQNQSLGDTHLKHHEATSNPINQKAVEKWREKLSEKQIQYISQRAQKWLSEKGYE